nr:hypothetical protein [Micromonospora sp. DSM 115978]
MLLALASTVALAAGCTGESAASSPTSAAVVPQALDSGVPDPHAAHPSSPAADDAGGAYDVTIERDEGDLPAVLANLQPVDATFEDERAVAEAEADIAAGRFIRCYGDNAFEALLDEFAAPEAKAS